MQKTCLKWHAMTGLIQAKSVMRYFTRRYMKLGVFDDGAGLELVDEEEGKGL